MFLGHGERYGPRLQACFLNKILSHNYNHCSIIQTKVKIVNKSCSKDKLGTTSMHISLHI